MVMPLATSDMPCVRASYTPGSIASASLSVFTLCVRMSSAVTTLMAAGTFSVSFSVRVAVTTISSMV